MGRLAAEAELSKTARELSQVLSATTDAIVAVNRDWEITYLNPSAVKTYAVGHELLGRKLWEKFPDAHYPESPYLKAYELAMHHNTPGAFEAFYPAPLNIWLRVSVFPTEDGIVTYSRNITEERLTAKALLQDEKLAAVGRLASSIAHEINNPLESVTNLLYLVRTNAESEEVKEYITSQTLRFHKQSTAPKSITSRELLEEVLSIYRGRITNANVEVSNRERSHRAVLCFEGEIRQVLSNLIGNAIDAMEAKGGRLLLRSREATDRKSETPGLVITVADTGSGMSPTTAQHLFEPFYTTKGISGTGLGLWICQEIIHRHKGHLRVRSSQREGHSGTVFTLFLPFGAESCFE